MKLAVIAPTDMLMKYTRTDYHLLLAHMRQDWQYKNYYRNVARGFKILDNSVIELGRAVSKEELEGAVLNFEPHELVLPDVPGDHATTYKNAEDLAPYFKERFPNMKLQVVPQAEDGGPVCFVKSMYKFLQLDIDTIGIPKSLGGDRLNVLRLIEGDRPAQWDYHLLGTTGDPIEVKRAAEDHPWLRGVDSKIPVRLGLNGVALHPTRGLLLPPDVRYQLPEMRFDDTQDLFPVIVDHNIAVMKGWAEGGTQGTVRQLRSMSAQG